MEAHSMTARREFPAKIKLAAFERSLGYCERCGGRLWIGKIRYNHRIPDGIGGEPTLDNCEVLCIACDNPQTYEIDIPRVAKAKRVQRKHAGIKKPSRFQTSRNSKWKKKISGEIVRRT